jgi:hypothetical protein
MYIRWSNLISVLSAILYSAWFGTEPMVLKICTYGFFSSIFRINRMIFISRSRDRFIYVPMFHLYHFFLNRGRVRSTRQFTAFITSLKIYSQVPKSRGNTNKPRTFTKKTLDQNAKAIRFKLHPRLQIDVDADLGLQCRRRRRATWRRLTDNADERSRCSGRAAALQPYSLEG